MEAKFVRSGDQILVYTDYNASLVHRMRGIPGRHWSRKLEANIFPLGAEKQVRDLVRQFFPIEGENDSPYKIVRVQIESQSTNLGSVCIDGERIFDSASGYLDTRPNGAFEIMGYEGGPIYQDGPASGEVVGISYVLTMKVREGAEWSKRGKVSYEFLDRQPVPDVFKDIFTDKEV